MQGTATGQGESYFLVPRAYCTELGQVPFKSPLDASGSKVLYDIHDIVKPQTEEPALCI
jgi:hypothetical protein